MPEIKFRLEGGEPVCLGDECPGRGHRIACPYADTSRGLTCIPGLRQQRDEFKTEVQEIKDFASSVLDVLEIATVNLGQEGALRALEAVVATNDTAKTKLQTIRTLIDEEEWNADFRDVLLAELGDGK